jgi:hypothetical protein
MSRIVQPEEITKEEFQSYEDVRESGDTNMFFISKVEELSGLSREKILAIMKGYMVLCEKYPGVRKG